MGADYKIKDFSVLGGTTFGTVAANVTVYVNPSGGDDFALLAQCAMRAPFDFLLDHLFLLSRNPPGAGETYTYTLMLGGAPTALTCTHGGAVDLTSEDVVNAVAIAQGDEIGIRVVTSAGAAVSLHMFSMRLRRI